MALAACALLTATDSGPAAPAASGPAEAYGACTTPPVSVAGKPGKKPVYLSEAACIAASAGVVRRDGASLVFERDGKRIVFTDENPPNDGEKFHNHRLVDIYADLDLYVVHNGYYEGDDYTIVDMRRGLKALMPARPHLSPGRTTLVAIQPDGNFHWNGIEIWAVTPTGLSRTLRFQPFDDVDYEFVRWVGDDRIDTVANPIVSPSGETITASVERVGPSWRIRHATYPRQNCEIEAPQREGQSSLVNEKAMLHDMGKIAARIGNTLKIRTRVGSTVVFTDGDCGDFCRYRLEKHFATNGVDVLSRFRDGIGLDYVLLDEKTGARADVNGYPLFALNGRTFAIVGQNVVEVWELNPSGFNRLARHEDTGAYCYAGWNGLDTLMLGVRKPDQSATVAGDLARVADGVWRLKLEPLLKGSIPPQEKRQ